jgi:hypothetical protein
MAATRAQSRALRGVLAWVLVLAGYKATPAEEMPPPEPSTPSPAAHRQPAEKSVSAIAAEAFEIAVRLKLVPDDKVIFREYMREKYASLDWAARLKALENLDALADEGVTDELSSAFAQVHASEARLDARQPEMVVPWEDRGPTGDVIAGLTIGTGETTHRRLEKRILALCTALKIDTNRRHEMTKRIYAHESLTELTEEQLREFADSLEHKAA